jgi:hypothetical protein
LPDTHITEDAGGLRAILTAELDAGGFESIGSVVERILSRIDDQRRSIGGNMPPEEIDPAARLKAIDPAHLLVIPVADIGPLLDLQYPTLVQRSTDLVEKAEAWERDHRNAVKQAVIVDDADTNRASDLYRQLRDHAGKDGEVDTARKTVKLEPYQATKAIDAWFANLSDRLSTAMSVIDASQNAYAKAKEAKERAALLEKQQLAQEEALRIQREAQAEARRIREEAEKAARELAEAARQTGDEALADRAIEAEQSAAEATQAANEAAELQIAAAQQAAAIANSQASASTADLTRTRSVIGTTTSASTSWKFSLTDIKKLAAAVVEGKAPSNFLTTNDAVINATIRGKQGLRDVPGLDIYPDTKVRRTGA